MPISKKGKRRLVVGDQVFWWNGDFGYWSGELRIVRDDRRMTVRVAWNYVRVPPVLSVFVLAPELPWHTPSQGQWAAYAYPWPNGGSVTPGVLRAVIDWCLDASQQRVALNNGAPTPAQPSPLLRRAAPIDRAFVAMFEGLLERPLSSRALDPVARDEVRALRLAAHLWETLASRGLIPHAWAYEGAISFVTSRLGDAPYTCVSAPPSLRALLALASDAAAVTRATALAREALNRFDATRGTPAQRATLAWYVVGDTWAVEHGDVLCVDGARPGDAMRAALAEALGVPRAEGEPPQFDGLVGANTLPTAAIEAAARDFGDAARWREACERDLRVPDVRGAALRCVGARFAELPDPFEALVALWRSGYGLGTVDAHTAVLLAPPLNDEALAPTSG